MVHQLYQYNETLDILHVDNNTTKISTIYLPTTFLLENMTSMIICPMNFSKKHVGHGISIMVSTQPKSLVTHFVVAKSLKVVVNDF